MGALQGERNDTLSTSTHHRLNINDPWWVGLLEVQERTYGNTRGAGRTERSGRAAETLMRQTHRNSKDFNSPVGAVGCWGSKPKLSRPTSGIRGNPTSGDGFH